MTGRSAKWASGRQEVIMPNDITNVEYVASADGSEYVIVNGSDIADDFDFEYDISANVTILHFLHDGKWYKYLMPNEVVRPEKKTSGGIPVKEIFDMLDGM